MKKSVSLPATAALLASFAARGDETTGGLGTALTRINAVQLENAPVGGGALPAFAFGAVILIFVALLASEIAIGRRRGLRIYTFGETVSNLMIYHGQQVVNFATVGLLALVYDGIHSRFGLFAFSPAKPLHWIPVLLLADLTYYVAHRSMHRVNLFLIPHSVHHQARDYNHVSSFRLPWVQRVFMFFFYSNLAFLGVPTTMLVGVMLLHLLCGIFAHSGVIRRKLGVLEYVFVTPRSHFVHHGTNPEYLDRNFGGIFVFWDRLFGTFAEYDPRVPVVLPAEAALDPVASNLDYLRKVVYAVRKERGFRAKLAIVLGTPERMFARLEAHGYLPPRPLRDARRPGDRARVYLLLAATAVVTTFLLVRGASLAAELRLVGAAIVLACSFSVGRLLERKEYAIRVNLERRTAQRPLAFPDRRRRAVA